MTTRFFNIGNLWFFDSKNDLDTTGSVQGLKAGAVAMVGGATSYTVDSVTSTTSASSMMAPPTVTTSHAYDTLNNPSTKYPSWLTGLFATGYGEDTEMVAPYDGALLKVVLETADGGGSTDVLFFRAGSSVATVTMSVSAGTAAAFDFTAQDNTFTEGQLIGLGVDPASAPGITRLTAVWQYSP